MKEEDLCVCVCVCESVFGLRLCMVVVVVVVEEVLPLKSASFSMSSPRSPVTVRDCLTFRFVSLTKRGEKKEYDTFDTKRRRMRTW